MPLRHFRGHQEQHGEGGSDEISEGSLLPQDPTKHGDDHAEGGSDEIDSPLPSEAYPLDYGSTRPSAGIDGRQFWVSDDEILWLDKGDAWSKIGVVRHPNLKLVSEDDHHDMPISGKDLGNHDRSKHDDIDQALETSSDVNFGSVETGEVKELTDLVFTKDGMEISEDDQHLYIRGQEGVKFRGYVPDFGTIYNIADLDADGITFFQDLDMYDNKITGLDDPDDDQDAANKRWVEKNFNDYSLESHDRKEHTDIDQALETSSDVEFNSVTSPEIKDVDFISFIESNTYIDAYDDDGSAALGLMAEDEIAFWGYNTFIGQPNPMLTLNWSDGHEFHQELSMGSYKITNLGDPENEQDAATKSYVDVEAGGPGWNVVHNESYDEHYDFTVDLTGDNAFSLYVAWMYITTNSRNTDLEITVNDWDRDEYNNLWLEDGDRNISRGESSWQPFRDGDYSMDQGLVKAVIGNPYDLNDIGGRTPRTVPSISISPQATSRYPYMVGFVGTIDSTGVAEQIDDLHFECSTDYDGLRIKVLGLDMDTAF